MSGLNIPTVAPLSSDAISDHSRLAADALFGFQERPFVTGPDSLVEVIYLAVWASVAAARATVGDDEAKILAGTITTAVKRSVKEAFAKNVTALTEGQKAAILAGELVEEGDR